ncbi:zinc finger protein [Forsythia ovata]|uniref:Zinc finger protein n=1 Tax=Forsythia ovata TaxID=205694 RepID=A0ABD1TBM9_9LAMI
MEAFEDHDGLGSDNNGGCYVPIMQCSSEMEVDKDNLEESLVYNDLPIGAGNVNDDGGTGEKVRGESDEALMESDYEMDEELHATAPCCHVIDVLHSRGMMVMDHVDDIYKRDAYLEHTPQNRRKKAGEQQKSTNATLEAAANATPSTSGNLSRKGLTMGCKKCGQPGHNKRSCKGALPPATNLVLLRGLTTPMVIPFLHGDRISHPPAEVSASGWLKKTNLKRKLPTDTSAGGWDIPLP